MFDAPMFIGEGSHVFTASLGSPGATDAGSPHCQCSKLAGRCCGKISQEDLLCHTCRAGCETASDDFHWRHLGTTV